MRRRLTRHDFIGHRGRREAELRLADRIEAELHGRPYIAPPPAAEVEAAPAPVVAVAAVEERAEARVPLRLDLRNAPSSMEMRAESWRGLR